MAQIGPGARILCERGCSRNWRASIAMASNLVKPPEISAALKNYPLHTATAQPGSARHITISKYDTSMCSYHFIEIFQSLEYRMG